jgi:hypothetical protein
MVTHHLNDDQIQQYLDDTLPLQERSAVKNHLKNCQTCQDAIASYQEVFEALGTGENFELSKNFARKVLRQTHKQAVGELQFGLMQVFFVLAAVIALSHVMVTYVNIENFAGTAQTTSKSFSALFGLLGAAMGNLFDNIQFDGSYIVFAVVGLIALFAIDRLVLQPHFKTGS